MDPFSRHGRAAAGGRLQAHACRCMNRRGGVMFWLRGENRGENVYQWEEKEAREEEDRISLVDFC